MDTFSWTLKSRYQTELHGVELLWNSIEFHKLCFCRIPWNSMSQCQTEFHQIEFLWNSIEFHGIPCPNTGQTEFHGIPWVILHGIAVSYFFLPLTTQPHTNICIQIKRCLYNWKRNVEFQMLRLMVMYTYGKAKKTHEPFPVV